MGEEDKCMGESSGLGLFLNRGRGGWKRERENEGEMRHTVLLSSLCVSPVRG